MSETSGSPVKDRYPLRPATYIHPDSMGEIMSDMSITPDQIREARERSLMTQQQLADAVGVSRRTIVSWERGESAAP
jgi:DNA-binding transcriptional regulator YiaG